jgi:DNA (cytosine-5)-methyltransferase 1
LLEKRKVDDKYFYDNRYDAYEKIKKSVTNKNRVYQWRRHYIRENKSGVCPTLTANMGSGGHNVPLILDKSGKIRKLTPRECARLQGFPDNFTFPDIKDSKLYHQFGNSVTVPLIVKIAIQIKKALT